MSKRGKTGCSVVVLALLTICSLESFADAEPEKQGLPEPLPPEVAKAWADANFEVGWVNDIPPKSGAYRFWTPWREKAEVGAIPAFNGRIDDLLSKPRNPETAFGLDFHCGGVKVATLQELAKFKNLRSLNIGAVRSLKAKECIDLKDIAGLTNLRALYLFYLPVTDAQLKHLKGLRNLQVLDLTNTEVTDGGLAELSGLSELRWLNLSNCEVTAKGLAAFQKTLPKCKITMPPK